MPRVSDERLSAAIGLFIRDESKLTTRTLACLDLRDCRVDLAATRAALRLASRALVHLYTFPGVRGRLAPSGSLGSIADECDAALAHPLVAAAAMEVSE